MSRTASRRLLAAQPPVTELLPTRNLPSRCLRPFSSSSSRLAEGDRPNRSVAAPRAMPKLPSMSFAARKATPLRGSLQSPSLHPQAKRETVSDLADMFNRITKRNNEQRPGGAIDNRGRGVKTETQYSSDRSGNLIAREGEHLETSWQLHVYATRHNVHITVVRPPNWYHPQTGKRYPEKGNNRTVALSLAAGNLGFRKAGRKHYDSAFQLASYVMGRMHESGMSAWIDQLEVFLRGFGAGREAVTKALLGTEGRYLRGKVVKVSDATRLKFGGTRSKKPRRLG
ncbi:hypothetical protein LZ554_004925 [Drepanopeziza brunnea f. sp. 'monogermtubi']|nr:hypothetical protein LZ554_004925 [Drepanopeziza brunnea f. sp. 'monogermtubi']